MRILLMGATGMVGQGVLRECLLADDVEKVLALGRTPLQAKHPKLESLVHKNLYDYSSIRESLRGYDACFFCLGISAAGLKEADYERMTHDLTLAAAKIFCEENPNMTFIYVSGAGTDSSEQGRVMWARIKGKTENALLKLPFKGAYMFRPAIIRPMYGVQSKTTLYRLFYALSAPIMPILTLLVSAKYMTTTERVGRAMLKVAREGYANPLVENAEIHLLGANP
jgi:uncharacterized protein YbjT (DUF2867 family)